MCPARLRWGDRSCPRAISLDFVSRDAFRYKLPRHKNSDNGRFVLKDGFLIESRREWGSLSNTQNRVGVVVNSKITILNDKRIGNLEVALNAVEREDATADLVRRYVC